MAENEVKHDIMDWAEGTGAGTKKGMEEPIRLTDSYPIHWNDYSKLDDSSTGSFWYLMNHITK